MEATSSPATRFTVVVPVHNVAGYLSECLDSLAGQTFDDFEVVAVDDASTDSSPLILQEYASRDERIRIITLEKNGGLGNARNLGLGAAEGEYVLFVDSDDWLDRDALRAIDERIVEASSPDLVYFEYARAYWMGKLARNMHEDVFSRLRDGVHTLGDQPELIELLMVATNKAFRRRFLIGLGQPFGTGYYEDVAVTYPALMAAQRIVLLDRVCYYYRQRRTGAITRTRSEGHVEVFRQYERIFRFIDDHAELDVHRAEIFRRTIWHYLIIFNNQWRLPQELRRRFFLTAAGHYRRFKPSDFALPSGADGRQFRLLERKAYAASNTLGRIRRMRLGVQDLAHRQLQSTRSRARRWVIRWKLWCYRGFRLLPVDPHLAIFAAYWYRGFACNPKAIYEKLCELAPHINAVWVVRGSDVDSFPPVPHVIEGTIAYYRLLARAKYLVNNVNFPNFVVKRKGTVHLQTQHGTPLKTMGLGLQRFPIAAKRMSFRGLLKRSDRWDYLLSSNPFSTQIWSRDFPCEYETLEYGYPRNDLYYAYDSADEAKIRGELGIGADKTVVLYAPTFRDYQNRFELHLDLSRFSRALGDGFVVLTRAHYYYRDLLDLEVLQERGTLIDVSDHPDVERLCLAADILLTDYSSIMFDYAHLGRPIVVYAHDWDVYRAVRGVNFDLLAAPPGATARSVDELIDVFQSKAYANDASMALLESFRARFCGVDDGHAAERVVRRIFMSETVAPPTPDVSDPARRSDVPVRA